MAERRGRGATDAGVGEKRAPAGRPGRVEGQPVGRSRPAQQLLRLCRQAKRASDDSQRRKADLRSRSCNRWPHNGCYLRMLGLSKVSWIHGGLNDGPFALPAAGCAAPFGSVVSSCRPLCTVTAPTVLPAAIVSIFLDRPFCESACRFRRIDRRWNEWVDVEVRAGGRNDKGYE